MGNNHCLCGRVGFQIIGQEPLIYLPVVGVLKKIKSLIKVFKIDLPRWSSGHPSRLLDLEIQY